MEPYDPVKEFEELPREERQDFLDSLDRDERSKVIQARAEKKGGDGQLGPFGSVKEQFSRQVDNALDR